MSIESRELSLYVENDGKLHEQATAGIIKNLTLKKYKGIYTHTGAVKLFLQLAELGAKRYAKEFGSGEDGEWHRMFSVADRKEMAEEFALGFEDEHKLGNCTNYLPKKYQPGKPAVKKPARNSAGAWSDAVGAAAGRLTRARKKASRI